MKVSLVDVTAAHLEAPGLRPQSVGDEIVPPPLRGDLIAEAAVRLVGAGMHITWVGLRHKSLKGTFLKLMEVPVVMPIASQMTGKRGRA